MKKDTEKEVCYVECSLHYISEHKPIELNAIQKYTFILIFSLNCFHRSNGCLESTQQFQLNEKCKENVTQ